MRHITPLALTIALSLCCAPSAPAQQQASRPSFAQRLASLRLGWGDSEEEETDPRKAIASTASGQRAGSNSGEQEERSGFAARLPRLNPGDLLPGDMFSGHTSDNSSQRSTSAQLRQRADSGRRPNATVGSARARIMRDLRVQASGIADEAPRVATREPVTNPQPTTPRTRQPEAAAENLAPRPQVPSGPVVLGRGGGRAGSVLSANPTSVGDNRPTAEPPTAVRPPVIREADLRRELLGPVGFVGSNSRSDRADSATAKSIAAAVASSMAEESLQAEEPTGAADSDELMAVAPETAALAEQHEAEDSIPPTPAKPQEDTTDRYATSSAPPIPTPVPAATPVGQSEPEEQAFAQTEAATVSPDEIIGQRFSADSAQSPAIETQSPAIESTPAATQSAGAQDGFEQDVAKRKFEATLDQSIEPRAAESPAGSWTVTAQPAASPQRTLPSPSVDADLLMSQRMPQIVSRVSGPKQIIIGREAVYRVTIANRGDETADQLATSVTVPEWAEVMGSRSTVGLVEPPSTREGATKVLWKMADLPPGKTEHLDLKLIARQGRPIELGVNWKHAPVGSRTMVEVQEPKLSVALDGPDEILFGKPQRFRLHVSNPGTGPAEDVRVKIASGTQTSGATHTLGDLLPNESRTIDFEITGSEAGEMKLLAQAVAMGNLAEQTHKSVFCRKPELGVDWRGPARKYAGAPATYFFRVRNPGTATAEGVEFRVNLPAGFEVSKASSGGRADSTGRQMQWSVGSLRPGDDYYMELQGVINQPGVNEFAMGAADADRLASATTTATTEVIALADLKLEIRDPKGPLPVGREAVYEVRVHNRGTNSAQQVKIVGLFSQGIEPYKVEGAEASIADGRVAIRTIERLGVGSELVLLIHAKATKPGAHIFRAEVLCQDLDIKLAAEETTRFYAEERIDLGEGPARSAGMADRFSTPR